MRQEIRKAHKRSSESFSPENHVYAQVHNQSKLTSS